MPASFGTSARVGRGRGSAPEGGIWDDGTAASGACGLHQQSHTQSVCATTMCRLLLRGARPHWHLLALLGARRRRQRVVCQRDEGAAEPLRDDRHLPAGGARASCGGRRRQRSCCPTESCRWAVAAQLAVVGGVASPSSKGFCLLSTPAPPSALCAECSSSARLCLTLPDRLVLPVPPCRATCTAAAPASWSGGSTPTGST